MNAKIIPLILLVALGAGAIVYSVGTHIVQSTGTITVNPAPEQGEITVSATIPFGAVTQGETTNPIQVHIGNTVGRSLTLTATGGIEGAVTIQLCTSDGTSIASETIPIGGGDIYLKATTTTLCPPTTGTFPITFTAS